ncbi:MAG: hypothetical protein Q9176_003627 [Flavoplaca citrina]
MDFQDTLDPPAEMKLAFPDTEDPSRTRLDELTSKEVERRTYPDSSQNPEPIGHDRVDPSDQERSDGTSTYPPGEPNMEDSRPVRSNEGVQQAISNKRPVGLAEVRDVVALEQYHKQRLALQQSALDNLTRTCSINSRLIPSLDRAHRALADCFQNGDSTGFAKVYRTCESIVEACVTHPVEASTMDLEDPVDHRHTTPISWLERLPRDCQQIIINFITDLRTDTNFLAERLSSLSFSELIELLPRSDTSRRPQSIFQGQPQRSTAAYNRSPPSQESELVLDKLRNLHQGDPFFVLSHGIFAIAGTQGSKERYLKNRVWSNACARVIVEGRPGSDDFTTCSLDAFFDSSNWALKPRLETFIAKVLQEGAFLVDPTSREPSDLKAPMEIRNANAVIAKSNFFDRALKDLLGLLLSFPPMSMLPNGLHNFICSTLGKIHNAEVRKRARNFIVSKWFVSSVLAQALTNPEEYGMMMCHHIGATARNNILREISSRLQKQIYDVIFSWKFAGPILDKQMHSLTEQLLSRFDVFDSELGHDSLLSSQTSSNDGPTLVLSAHDILSLIRALYPKVLNSAPSANPSTAGSSTLVSESLWSGEAGKSTISSTNDTSTVDPIPYKTEPVQSWNARLNPTITEADDHVVNLSGKKEEYSQTLDDQILRTYRCLTSTVQPLPTQSAGMAPPDWAHFTVCDYGKVRSSSSGNGLLHPDDRTADHLGATEATDDRINGLVVPIKRLLSLHTPQSVNVRQAEQPDETGPELALLVQAAIDQANTRYDYQDMHFWWQAKIALQDNPGSLDMLLRSIYKTCQQVIRMNGDILRGIEGSLYTLSSLQESQSRRMTEARRSRKAFRMKMWYVSDVRHSSTFEDALHVIQALRAMADPSRSKQPTGVTNWAKNRLRNVVGHDRTSAQILDAMTEPNEYSGISKLNDDQVERTTRWLTKNSVENFCRGEERVHRFCLEIQKCTNKLTGPTLLESPVLWSSPLFEQEKKAFGRKAPNTYEQQFYNVNGNISHASSVHSMASLPTFATQQSHGGAQYQANTQWMRPLQVDGRAGLGSPKTRLNFGDSFAREPVRTLPYHMSHASLSTQGSVWSSDHLGYSQSPGDAQGSREDFAADIKKGLYSLVLSDLGYLSWHSGSETDSWLRQSCLDDLVGPLGHGTSGSYSVEGGSQPPDKLGQEPGKPLQKLQTLLTAATAAWQDHTSKWQAEDNVKSSTVSSLPQSAFQPKDKPWFPYWQTYKAILDRFSMSDDPQDKLQRLRELEQLISHSIQESLHKASPQGGSKYTTRRDAFHLKSMLVPRTKATSFEEVIANCTERRAGTMRFKNVAQTPSPSPNSPTFGTDEVVETLLSIFRDPELRPRTLFRDLQYIAAFVPAVILDQSARGKAFWDAGLAALAFKQELCDAMIVRATEITKYHILASSFSSPPPSNIQPAELAHTTLRDAAELWIIAAKEGSATAARELALLYLTHPELLPRTTLQPFSKPKEVFRTVSAKKEGSMAEEGRLDPVTFAVVFHWMEVAANGGDKDARDFLRNNGGWGTGR